MTWEANRAALALLLSAVLTTTPPAHAAKQLTGSWATSLLDLGKDNSAADEDMRDATIRQVVRISLGGNRLRVRVSNLFGRTPLVIDAATVAVSSGNASPGIVAKSLRPLTFGGNDRIKIAPGAEAWTDLVEVTLRNGEDVAISMHILAAPDGQTGHPGSRANSWFAHGEQTRAETFTDAKAITRWFFLGGIETDASPARAVVIMGDSITDGYGVKPGTNERWTDFLRARVQARSDMANVAVLNAGIGGNRIRLDGVGPKPLSRLKREVLDVPGVSHLIFLEGVNDLRGMALKGPMTREEHIRLVGEIVANMQEIVAQARARGIKVIGATILPFGRSVAKAAPPVDFGDWRAVNEWIRTPGNFDGVIDFARIMADPADENLLLADYDNDGLHPSIVGYRAMANAVPLGLLKLQPTR